MTPFPELVADELIRARAGHPIGMHTAHEAYGVILEELDEFWGWVRLKADHRDRRAMLKELVQVASMCQRAAEDLKLL